ncbi:type IV toxin-antitoxin system AbiEi family antitoxin domain-containing protein [Thermodesulfitimonas sp.]
MIFFRQHAAKKIFALADIEQMTGLPKSHLQVERGRLVRHGVLRRLARQWYANPFAPPSIEEAAMVFRYPSYISLEYALAQEGVLSQTAFTVTLVTTKSPYTFHLEGTTLEYHQIARRLFWGYRFDGRANVALPEKALLDLIYIRHLKTGVLTATRLNSLLDDIYLEKLDRERLWSFAVRFGPPHAKQLTAVLAPRVDGPFKVAEPEDFKAARAGQRKGAREELRPASKHRSRK